MPDEFERFTETRCQWCNQVLRFDPNNGWVHTTTGTLYLTRVDADGIERDDHCALPVHS